MTDAPKTDRKPRATKEEAFKANASRLVNEIMARTAQLGALAAKEAHTKEQVEKIFKTLDASLNSAHDMFENPTKAKGQGFDL